MPSKAAQGIFGVVTSSHWIASLVGMEILENGGNAFDAAVAAGFAMQVVEPHQNGLGGDVVIMAYPGSTERPTVICGQGVAPANASIDRYRALGLDLIPPSGFLPAVVPGAFDAWMILLRDYGVLSLRDVLHPAAVYAHAGHALSAEASRQIEKAADLFRTKWSTSAAVYLPHNEPPSAGSTFSNAALAATYQELIKIGEDASSDRCMQIEAARAAFYKGYIAEKIDKFFATPISTDINSAPVSGFLTGQDLATWEATSEPPISFFCHGLTVFKPRFWTQGPAFLQTIGLLQQTGLSQLRPLSAEYIHAIVECLKLAYADREAWFGDSSEVSPHLQNLLDTDYLSSRSHLIGDKASMEVVPGQLNGEQGRLPRFSCNVSGGAAEESAKDSKASVLGDTCHIDVIDRWGNAVAATPSAGWLHGSPVIPGLGFSISNRGQMFWLQEGLASSLEPKSRPRTTLSPTAALGKDKRLVFGSRGGDYQDQWMLQSFLMHAIHGAELQASLDVPMFHSDHWPRSEYPRDANLGKLTLDDRIDPAVVSSLRAMGHNIRIQKGRRWGRSCAAVKDGRRLAAAAASCIPQGGSFGR
jgi:gamma-glutamyltranspeptidase/glutathione hydrolase